MIEHESHRILFENRVSCGTSCRSVDSRVPFCFLEALLPSKLAAERSQRVECDVERFAERKRSGMYDPDVFVQSDLSTFLSAAPFLRASPILRSLQAAFKADLLCYLDLMSSMIREAQKRVLDIETNKANSAKLKEAKEKETEAASNASNASDASDASELNEAERTKEENVSLESKVYEASLRRLKELAVSLRYGTNKCD